MSLHLSNAKGNYKCMKDYDEIKKSHIFNTGM